MKIPFFGSKASSQQPTRSSSTSHAVLKSLRRKKSAPDLSLSEPAIETFPSELHNNLAAQKKRQSGAHFFHDLAHGETSSKLRQRASRYIRPAQPSQSTGDQAKPVEIDDELLERILGKPKVEKKASENFLAKQKDRAQARAEMSASRAPLSTNEIRLMFEGAPQFKVVKTQAGYQPTVEWVGGETLGIGNVENDPASPVEPSRGKSARSVSKQPTNMISTQDQSQQNHMNRTNCTDPGATTLHNFLRLPVTEDNGDPAASSVLDDQKHSTSDILEFAEALHWPNVQVLEASMLSQESFSAAIRPTSTAFSVYLTPPESPGYEKEGLALASSDSANQAVLAAAIRKRTAGGTAIPSIDRGCPSPVDSLDAVGADASTVSTSQDLMQALLKRMPEAQAIGGDVPNPNGGFVYAGRSFWSNTSVAGRVLAAIDGSIERTGWISVPYVPENAVDGWLELDARETADSATIARIFAAESVSNDSGLCGSDQEVSVAAQDFARPSDGLPVMGNEVRFEGAGLSFSPEGEITSNSMKLTFASPINNKLEKLDLSLTNDVQFISTSPCFSSRRPQQSSSKSLTPIHERPRSGISNVSTAACSYSELLPSDFEALHRVQSSAQPPNRQSRAQPDDNWFGIGANTHSDNSSIFPCHPLHNDYKFEMIPAATLLTLPVEEQPRPPTAPIPRRPSAPPLSGFDKAPVVVLDCRGTDCLQLLARAWCASAGEHAVISKVGRTCLACSIREARALDMGIVIRIA